MTIPGCGPEPEAGLKTVTLTFFMELGLGHPQLSAIAPQILVK